MSAATEKSAEANAIDLQAELFAIELERVTLSMEAAVDYLIEGSVGENESSAKGMAILNVSLVELRRLKGCVPGDQP